MEPKYEAPITTNIDGGLGTNKISVNYSFMRLLDPGTGTATEGFNIPLRTNVKGGERGNDIRVLFTAAGARC